MIDLGTTNLLLGILAVCSIIEVLALIGAGIGGFIAYRRVMQIVDGLEQRQVAPAMARESADRVDARRQDRDRGVFERRDGASAAGAGAGTAVVE